MREREILSDVVCSQELVHVMYIAEWKSEMLQQVCVLLEFSSYPSRIEGCECSGVSVTKARKVVCEKKLPPSLNLLWSFSMCGQK